MIGKYCFDESVASSNVVPSFWLCGPNAMTDGIEKLLKDKFKVSQNDIHYERWW